jgi:hypothetical protein
MELSPNSEAMKMLSAARASTDKAAAAPDHLPVPDDTDHVFQSLVHSCHEKHLGKQSLADFDDGALVLLYDTPKVLLLGKTLEDLVTRFGEIVRALVLNNGTGPKGLLS